MQPFDDFILTKPQGTVQVSMCAKEVLVLRIIGTRWQDFIRGVVAAHAECQQHPTAFGDTDIKVFVIRKYTQDAVVGTLVHEIQLPQEMFVWPLSK